MRRVAGTSANAAPPPHPRSSARAVPTAPFPPRAVQAAPAIGVERPPRRCSGRDRGHDRSRSRRRAPNSAAPAVDQVGQEGGMVQHPVVAAQRRVFVAQDVQRVPVHRQDGGDAVAAEHRDVAAGEVLERYLVAQPAGEVATVQFLGAKHRDVHRCPAQHRDKGAQAALVAPVEAALANPQQQVGVADVGHQRQPKIGRPVEPRIQRAARYGVRLAQLGERHGRVRGHRAVFQRGIPPQVDDGIDMLDQHWAFVHTGAAGGAGPQRIGADPGGGIGRPGQRPDLASVCGRDGLHERLKTTASD